jgi:hypothetical protein
VESIYRFVIFRLIELGLLHMCDRYFRCSDKQCIAEAVDLGNLPPDFMLPDWDYNVAPNTFQPVISGLIGQAHCQTCQHSFCQPS